MLLFLFRLLKQLLYFVCVTTPLQLFFALVLLVYLPQDKGQYWKLPKWLRWADCADLYSEFGRSPVTYLMVVYPKGWWARYCWLAWRNPLNYFSYKYESLQWTADAKYGQFQGITDNIGDGIGQKSGLRYIEIEQNNKKYYEYYYIRKWSNRTCFRFRMGWKIKDRKNKPGSYSQSVFVISPYHSYEGV